MTRARRARLITDNMPLVRKVARQVARKFSPRLALEDFVQDGYLGLCEAARRCTRVTSFQQFAYFRIRGAMVDAHRRKAYREELNPSLEGMAEIQSAKSWGKPMADVIAHGVQRRDSGPLPDELAAIAERDQFAACAIAELPEDERYVISEALDGVKLAAIAESRNRSATWARSKLSIARGKVAAAVALGRAA